MKTGIICIVIFFFTGLFTVNGQTDKVTIKNADKKALKHFRESGFLLNSRQYDKSLEELKKAISIEPNFIDAHMRVGDIYSFNNNIEEARTSYLKVIEIDPNHIKQVYLVLGELETEIGNYAAAIPYLEKFLGFTNIIYSRKLRGQRSLNNSRFGVEALKNPVPFEPINLGDSINSVLSEYHPVLTIDGKAIIFTRRLEIKNKPNSYNEDFFISIKDKNDQWSKARNLGAPINTFLNEGAHSVSPDGNSIYFTACNRPDGFGRCDIYFTKKVGDRWIAPLNIGPPINTPDWESQPSISSDGNTLYFCSNRKGSVGKIDIWVSHKTNDGKWGFPKNLGKRINTELNEQSPFIHPDNETLYFSSEGHPGMGKEDIYITRKDTNDIWSKPINLGYPINTYNTEANLSVTSDGTLAFFSSGHYETNRGLDLYYFKLYPEVRPKKVTYVKGKVFNSVTNRKLGARIELFDLETGGLIMSTLSDRVKGTFLICLHSGKNYAFNVSKKGFLFYSDHFSLKNRDSDKPYILDIGLQPIEVGQSVVLKNIFFETASFELKSESKLELNKLTALLKENPDMIIEIGGHTDNVGEISYNQKLSENRAKAVQKYLLEKGIELKRLSYKGYGATQPIATNETDTGRAQNRRTAFTVVGE